MESLEFYNEKVEVKKEYISPYTLLSRWLFDGSKTTKIPEDILKDKSISNMYLLYFFQASPYMLYISKHFNNYYLFQMNREDVFKFIKECVSLCGFRPPFVQKLKKNKSELAECLKFKYPFLKEEELYMIVKFIDESPDKDSIYEQFDLYKSKKKKLTKEEQKKLQKEVETASKDTVAKKEQSFSLNDLMGNFS